MSLAFRSLDLNGDWTFGKGRQNYAIKNKAIAFDIQTKLLSFLGDCFFATQDGLDWLNILGSKDKTNLEREVTKAIIDIRGVSKVLNVTINESRVSRAVTVTYNIITIYDDPLSGEVVQTL